jgi:hypothetical protein
VITCGVVAVMFRVRRTGKLEAVRAPEKPVRVRLRRRVTDPDSRFVEVTKPVPVMDTEVN